MRRSRPALLLVPLLLTAPPPAGAQADPCPSSLHLEPSSVEEAPPKLCISGERPTTLLFDAPLAPGSVRLEGRERFRRVEVAGNVLVLVPAAPLPPQARLRLEVRFLRGEPAAGAALTLVAHPSLAEHHVEVSLARPSPSACEQELHAQAARLQQCLEQRARPETAPAAPPSLLSLVSSGLIDERGVSFTRLMPGDLRTRASPGIDVKRIIVYRSSSRALLEVHLRLADGSPPWALEGAALRGARGQPPEVLWLKPSAPVAAGVDHTLWVELAAPALEPPEGYTLHLWDAGRERTAVVQGVRLR